MKNKNNFISFAIITMLFCGIANAPTLCKQVYENIREKLIKVLIG